MPTIFTASGADDYEYLMGRWSRRLAEVFCDFAGVRDGESILDAGCGTGSLTFALARRAEAVSVTGIDFSEAYVEFARGRNTDPRIEFHAGDACDMPFADARFDRALSMLVLNFIPDAPRAAAEMVRVTRPGGVVASATWDLRGGLPAYRMFWDTAAVLDPEASRARARYQAGPLTGPGQMAALWTSLGLREVEQTSLMIRMDFKNFDDYWAPLLGKTGPAGAYLDAISENRRSELAGWLRAAYLGGGADGPRSFAAVAWACRGRVPD